MKIKTTNSITTTTTTTMNMLAAPTTSNTILKISARAFTNPFLSPSLPSSLSSKGGNPVTIFHFPGNNGKRRIPSSELRSKLAKTCPWESVVSYSGYDYKNSQSNVESFHVGNGGKDVGETNRIWFYMPNGEEVSYCAHAAMAACSVLKQYEDDIKDGAARRHSTVQVDNSAIRFVTGIISDDEEEGVDAPLLENIARVQTKTKTSDSNDDQQQQQHNEFNEVTLQMSSTLHEEPVNHDNVLKLLDQVGLSYDDVITSNSNLPSFINSSVARHKTLVPIKKSMLNSATNPKDAILFRNLCDEIQSTGLYLYTPSSPLDSSLSSSSSSSYECRQFPRFSGYPEDPATGIAAAALANSLFSRGISCSCNELDSDSSYNNSTNDGAVMLETDTTEASSFLYELFQGVAMGKPSRIKIRIDFKKGKDHNGYDYKNNPTLSCSGIVEIDSIHEIKI